MKRSFSLIELIVVVAILIILFAVAVIWIKHMLSKWRDSQRIADLRLIKDVFDTYIVDKGELPYPDNYVEIRDGEFLISYQWEVGQKVVNTIWSFNKVPKDPKDDILYTYVLFKDRQKFQLLALLENDNIEYINYADAYDFSKRYFYVKWDEIGIIVTSRNVPVEKLGFWKINLNHLRSNFKKYKIIFGSNKVFSWDGRKLASKLWEMIFGIDSNNRCGLKPSNQHYPYVSWKNIIDCLPRKFQGDYYVIVYPYDLSGSWMDFDKDWKYEWCKEDIPWYDDKKCILYVNYRNRFFLYSRGRRRLLRYIDSTSHNEAVQFCNSLTWLGIKWRLPYMSIFDNCFRVDINKMWKDESCVIYYMLSNGYTSNDDFFHVLTDKVYLYARWANWSYKRIWTPSSEGSWRWANCVSKQFYNIK